MKANRLFLLFSLSFHLSINAQIRPTPTITLLSNETKEYLDEKASNFFDKIMGNPELEFFAGYDLSMMSVKANDVKIRSELGSGFSAGLKVVGEESLRTVFEFGIAFTLMGTSYRTSETRTNADLITQQYDVNTETICYGFTVPLDVKHRFGYKRIKYVVNYGCFLSFGMDFRNKLDVNYTETLPSGISTIEDYSETIIEDYDRYDVAYADFGLSVGIGLEILKNFRVGLRYNHGFVNLAQSDIRAGNNSYFLFDSNYKSRVLSISLGYILLSKRDGGDSE